MSSAVPALYRGARGILLRADSPQLEDQRYLSLTFDIQIRIHAAIPVYQGVIVPATENANDIVMRMLVADVLTAPFKIYLAPINSHLSLVTLALPLRHLDGL